MNQTGDEFLPCPCFSGHQHRGVRRRDGPDQGQEIVKGGALAYDAAGFLLRRQLLLQLDILLRQFHIAEEHGECVPLRRLEVL